MTSVETKRMLKSRKGYRCESYGGSGERRPSSVIRFEVEELGNADILDDACKALDVCSVEALKDYDDTHVAIWLADKKSVKRYCEGDRPQEFSIPKNAIVLTDLGDEGALFLWRKHG